MAELNINELFNPETLRNLHHLSQIRYINAPVDVLEDNNCIYAYVELPGVNKQDIELDFYNNQLTVIATKTRIYPEPNIKEIKYGNIERVITLPICVTRRDTVKVTLENGILKIRIDKFIEEENRFSVRVDE